MVLALVVWGVWSAVSAALGGGATNGTPNGQPSATVIAGAGEPCAPGAVSVTAHVGDQKSTDKQNFDKGEKPYIWFTLKNTGTVDCTFSAGSNVQFYTITSGAETIWSSKDCDRSADTAATITLKVGVEQSSPASLWDRVYSAGGGSGSGCSAKDGQTPVTGGGASYHLTATVGGVLSVNDVQFVLY